MEILITEEDRLLFEKYSDLNKTIKQSGFVRNYTAEAYNHLLYLYMKYVSIQHTFTHWCGDCRLQLVQQLYSWYEKKLSNQADEIIKEIVEAVGEPAPPTEQVKKKRGRKPKGGCNEC